MRIFFIIDLNVKKCINLLLWEINIYEKLKIKIEIREKKKLSLHLCSCSYRIFVKKFKMQIYMLF